MKLGLNLFLRLQLAFVLADKRLDQRSAGKDTEPLFLVKRDWKAPHAVQGDRALFADLQAQPGFVFVLELCILCPKALQLRLHSSAAESAPYRWGGTRQRQID